MKTSSLLLVLFLSGISDSFAKPYDVTYDYDKNVNFANLKTYNWMPVPEKSGVDSFVVQRVKNAVNAELKAKGLTMTSSNPDFLIAEHLGKEDKVQTDTWGYDYGARGRYWGGGYGAPAAVSTYEYQEGSLILDFVDSKSKQLIWRGSAKAEVQNIRTPEKSEKVINKAVKMMMKKFPPP